MVEGDVRSCWNTHVTPPDLLQLIGQYRAGLEAEMVLLHRLEALAERQRHASEQTDLEALALVSDDRDRLMASLVRIEHELKPVRLMLLEGRTAIDKTPEFQDLIVLHREAADLVSTIVGHDRDSLSALHEAELARRFAARTIEQGENTLAAYRRVVAPVLAGATLVNRKG
jgi:hypothetical protein